MSCIESAGGELDQIQFLLGHVSVQTTERYLGCKQRLHTLPMIGSGWNRISRSLRRFHPLADFVINLLLNEPGAPQWCFTKLAFKQMPSQHSRRHDSDLSLTGWRRSEPLVVCNRLGEGHADSVLWL